MLAGNRLLYFHGLNFPTMNPDGDRGAFRPVDFARVLVQLPEGCPIVGGQAVVWWAERYKITPAKHQPLTSEDIDFWGGRADLEQVASRLGIKPIFPQAHEMSVWAGAIPIIIDGHKSLADFLHTIPGLDVIDPDQASIKQQFSFNEGRRTLEVLSPISLVLAKLHALRHFDQKDRQDEMHLRVCLEASVAFLSEILAMGELRQLFWNLERLIAAHRLKAYQRLEKEYGFNLLDSIPIAAIERTANDPQRSAEYREKLLGFLTHRWRQVKRARTANH